MLVMMERHVQMEMYVVNTPVFHKDTMVGANNSMMQWARQNDMYVCMHARSSHNDA